MAKSNDPSNPEELVKYIASCLVENVDKIDIETVEEDNKTILKLTVDETDKGKIIGKNGKIAKSIRNVLKLASTKDNNKYILEIT
ncbi:MAG: KH domain-containing protein [SAR202 cluster bacterium]|nr:KH domain-containing protein [SAR202 cluster bacterium]OUU76598.1 MAG: hypothetical protein CBC30_03260 [Chloroflexi bacterium TMED70]RZP16835.1 MAG: KH domain-containing protein [Chloroflexota bacterium]|tara:strand:+ start:16415 stop:16669 length:255 start_codon:yes stop_codon:yes gene_type:complete